jgi:hypothetical protein
LAEGTEVLAYSHHALAVGFRAESDRDITFQLAFLLELFESLEYLVIT